MVMCEQPGYVYSNRRHWYRWRSLTRHAGKHKVNKFCQNLNDSAHAVLYCMQPVRIGPHLTFSTSENSQEDLVKNCLAICRMASVSLTMSVILFALFACLCVCGVVWWCVCVCVHMRMPLCVCMCVHCAESLHGYHMLILCVYVTGFPSASTPSY